MIIDFRRSQHNVSQTVIQNMNVETVDEYKYLGTIIDSKLSFESNTDAACKKAQQRLFFLRKMKSFSVCRTLMTLFYQCFIESVLTFCIVVWYSGLPMTNKRKLTKLVNVASKVVGVQLSQLQHIYDRRVRGKANQILNCPDHPLFGEFNLLPSGRRFRLPMLRTKRARDSFIPVAIRNIDIEQ